MVYNMAKLFRLRLFWLQRNKMDGQDNTPRPENSEDHTWLITRAIPAPYANKNSKKQMISLSARTAAHRTTANAGKRYGVCVHQADHAAGFEWTPDNVISDRPDDIVCPNCGTITRWRKILQPLRVSLPDHPDNVQSAARTPAPPPAATARCTPTAAQPGRRAPQYRQAPRQEQAPDQEFFQCRQHGAGWLYLQGSRPR